MDFCIGSDILDIGSRRAEIKLQQYHQRSQNDDFMNTSGPSHFDVPNVSNVRNDLRLILFVCLSVMHRQNYNSIIRISQSFGFNIRPIFIPTTTTTTTTAGHVLSESLCLRKWEFRSKSRN